MNKLIIFSLLFLSFIVYSFIVYTYGTELNRQPENENAIKGKLLFQKYNCISCHQIYGLGGYLGADLTTVISAEGKGEEYAKVFIKYGTRQMPDFKLNDNDVRFIIEYLKVVDQSAVTYKRNVINYGKEN